jgi:hypothetical protein
LLFFRIISKRDGSVVAQTRVARIQCPKEVRQERLFIARGHLVQKRGVVFVPREEADGALADAISFVFQRPGHGAPRRPGVLVHSAKQIDDTHSCAVRLVGAGRRQKIADPAWKIPRVTPPKLSITMSARRFEATLKNA